MRAKLVRCVGLLVLTLVPTAGVAKDQASDQRLVAAAQARDLPAVRALLAAGANVNARRADGATALLWAAHWDDAALADALLGAGADANIAEERGVTPLMQACENRSEAMVLKLLDARANPNAAQQNGVTPLMMAARTGNAAIVKTLLARGADVSVAVPTTGQTALMWSIAEKHLDIARELIAAKADVHNPSKIGFTPLLFATRNGDLEAVKMLIAAGVGVNEPGSDGTHALPLAIISGQDDLASFFLENGADPNSTMYGVPALHAAVGRVDDWLRDWFRERGVNIYAGPTIGIEQARRVRLVKSLLAAGADVNGRITAESFVKGLGVTGRHGARENYSTGIGSARGATPVWVASMYVQGPVRMQPGAPAEADPVEMLRVLLEAGGDPRVATEDGTTPLMMAAGLGTRARQPDKKRGDPIPTALAAVKILVAAGVDVNAANEAGFTALHGAAYRGDNDIIQSLVEHGANVNAQEFRGRTAYRIAVGSQQGNFFQAWPETAELLKQLGADTNLGPQTAITASSPAP